MISAAKSRLNHYATLGLATSASEDEIREAFAKAMFAPHGMADAAQIGMAYEVLRNPAKRRAYDEALGLRPVAAPVQAHPSAVAFRISARVVGSSPEPQAAPAPDPPAERPLERAVGSFIAQSLREPPEAPLPAEAEIEELTAAPPPYMRSADPEPQPAPWSRSVLAAGGLALAVVLVGAWAGLEAGDASQAQPAEVLTTPLPKARPALEAVLDASAPAKPVASASLSTKRTPAAKPRQRSVEQATASPPANSYSDITGADDTAEIAVAETSPTETKPVENAAAATFPLPGKVVARTLHRIGYGCGQVASTTAIDGSAGVYKVTCTSGQEYRAAPVRGRYHFSRLARQ